MNEGSDVNFKTGLIRKSPPLFQPLDIASQMIVFGTQQSNHLKNVEGSRSKDFVRLGVEERERGRDRGEVREREGEREREGGRGERGKKEKEKRT